MLHWFVTLFCFDIQSWLALVMVAAAHVLAVQLVMLVIPSLLFFLLPFSVSNPLSNGALFLSPGIGQWCQLSMWMAMLGSWSGSCVRLLSIGRFFPLYWCFFAASFSALTVDEGAAMAEVFYGGSMLSP
jgi:hypothetical protein